MLRAYPKFALRAEYKAKCASVARFGASGLVALGLCLGLAACVDDGNYPDIAKISDVGTVLTPEERQKAVEDLQKQNRHRTRTSDASKNTAQQ
jgi:hypothetical protein